VSDDHPPIRPLRATVCDPTGASVSTGAVARATFHGMNDTDPEAAAVVKAAILRRDPVERMRQAFAQSEAMRELALSRLRVRYPDRSTIELVELLLGARLMPEASAPGRP